MVAKNTFENLRGTIRQKSGIIEYNVYTISLMYRTLSYMHNHANPY